MSESSTISIEKKVNGFDWYRLTELSDDLLNSLIVCYAKKIEKEEGKETPDEPLISWYNKRIDHIQGIRYKSENFDSIEKMKTIIDKYSSELKKENERA